MHEFSVIGRKLLIKEKEICGYNPKAYIICGLGMFVGSLSSLSLSPFLKYTLNQTRAITDLSIQRHSLSEMTETFIWKVLKLSEDIHD